MKFLKPSLVTSLAACILTIASLIEFGFAPALDHNSIAVFFGTFIYYNIHKIYFRFKSSNIKIDAFTIQVITCLVGFIVTLFYASRAELCFLFGASLFSLIYSFPYLNNKSVLFNIRTIPYVKSFIVVIVWSFVTVFLPLTTSIWSINKLQLMLVVISRIMFLFAIIIPFDIMHMSDDKKIGLKTMPLLLGEKKARSLSNFILAISFLLSLVIYTISGGIEILFAHLLSYVISIFVLNKITVKDQKIYYDYILDGLILFQGLLIVISFYI